MDPDNLVSEEKADYWVKFNYGIIDDATDNTLHPFNTMVILYLSTLYLPSERPVSIHRYFTLCIVDFVPH